MDHNTLAIKDSSYIAIYSNKDKHESSDEETAEELM